MGPKVAPSGEAAGGGPESTQLPRSPLPPWGIFEALVIWYVNQKLKIGLVF